jgi:hypothetical protein
MKRQPRSTLMVRIFSAVILFAALTGISSAAEQYRMCLVHASGMISLPDEAPRARKVYFFPLNEVGLALNPPQFFGGGSGKRFKALKYDEERKVLTCEEVDTKKIFELEAGKWINFLELPP